jgi:hypothetical protein
MCSIMAAGLAISMLGTLSQAAGQRQQAEAAEKSAQFNAQVARNNATVARQQAVQAHDTGKVKSAQEALKARQLAGLSRTAGAGRGALVSGESEAQAIEEIRNRAGVDVATIRSNTARESLGFITQGANFDAQGGLILAEGSNRASALNAQASASLLTGAGSVATKWNAYRDTGGTLA